MKEPRESLPRICKTCVLPSNFPSIVFDENGICQYCREATGKPQESSADLRANAEAMVRSTFPDSGPHKIIVAFSGGKDSSYCLKYLRDVFGRNILAVTLDNGFISPTARSNCVKLTAALGIDHLFVKPEFGLMSEIYRASVENDIHSKAALMRASSVCNSCIRVIDNQILGLAIARKIPVVAWGYIEGQAAIPGGVLSHELGATLPFRRDFLRRLGPHVSGEALRLLEPSFGSGENVLLFCPLVYLEISEQTILSELSALGWEQPPDTGEFSTNCRLNEFGIDRHKAKTGLHPYLFKTASQVRRGLLERAEALRRLTSGPDKRELDEIEKALYPDTNK